VTIAAAQNDLDVVYSRLATEYPQTNAKIGSWLIPLHVQLTGSSRAAIITLSVAVGLVLLIGCVNLANLLLVRTARRSREIGVRAAIGAGRSRLVRQLLTESALLAVIGGSIGLALGIAGSRLLASFVPQDVRRVQDIGIDGSVFLFAAAVTLVSAAIFGVFPALSAVRSALSNSVRGGREGDGRAAVRTHKTLVVTQLAMAVMLLVGAGLLLRSFIMMQNVDMGYRTEGVGIAPVAFPGTRYANAAAINVAYEDLLARVRANPAIKSAELTDLPVLNIGGDQDISASVMGEPENPNLPPSLWIRSVTPGYLSTMHFRLVSGRQLSTDDKTGTGLVGIINEYAAERYFPGKSAIGRQLVRGSAQNTPITIIGVVANGRQDGPNQPYKPELFVPLAQRPARFLSVIVEPSRDLAAASSAYGQALREVDPLLPVRTLTPIEETVGGAIALPKLYATLVAIFAAAALLLASLGVYGVMAYSVSQRQREIGIRMALGAEPSGIRRMVLKQGTTLAAIGLAIGVGASMMLGQFLSKVLFGVTPFDPPTLIAVPTVLGIVTVIASWLPARQAMRLDPVAVIRPD
jgi:predicted permease